MKDKILFCQFARFSFGQVPLDIGYALASIKNRSKELFDQVDFLQLSLIPGELEDPEFRIDSDIKLILIHKPKAVFFFVDNLLWSGVYTLGRAKRLAKRLRQELPGIFIGIHSYKFMPDHYDHKEKLFDCLISANPEEVFPELENVVNKRPVPGVFYFDSEFMVDSRVICDKKEENTNTLDYIASPYLDGIFDDLLSVYRNRLGDGYRAFLITSRGCSFGCYYCFRSVKFEKVRFFSPKRFYDEIEYLNNNFGIKHFFVLDDAFAMHYKRLEEIRAEYRVRLKKNKKLKNVDLFVMLRPESLSGEAIKILKEIGVKKIQIGLQTVNPDIQHYMNRKIEVEKFHSIVADLRKNKIGFMIDVILGLPGDSVDFFKKTLEFAIRLEPEHMQVKQFYLNPHTLFYQKKDEYGIKIGERRDFYVPFVEEVNGKDYFPESVKLLRQVSEENPQVKWKIITPKFRFLSDGYYKKGL